VAVFEQRLEEAAVGVEAGGVENRVLGPEEPGEPRLQLLVHVLRPADEAHRRHAVAVAIERLSSRLDDRRVRGEPEVIVRAKVQDLAATLHADERALRTLDDALAFEEALAVQTLGLLVQLS